MFIAPQSRPCAPSQLREHHADVLRALGHVDAEQALDGQAVGMLVGHHRHVVEAVHVRQALDIRLALGEFLGGAVQETDVRVGSLDDFAVQLEHESENAVGRRMLRAKVQGVVLDLGHLSASRRSCLRARCAA
jgi:hypothetical protein